MPESLEINISIASLRTRLVMAPSPVADQAAGRYAPFASRAGAGPHFTFIVQWNGEGLALNTEDPVTVRRVQGAIHMARGDFRAEFDPATGAGRLDIIENIYVMDSFLRVFYSIILPDGNGLLLHSSGVIKDGAGYAFIGPSGRGKTTASRNAPARGLLSDELTAVRLKSGRVRVYGTPFMGELATGSVQRNASAEALFFLKRDLPYRNSPIGNAVAVARLLECILNFDSDPARVKKIFNVACEICASAPCRELSFDRNSDFWPQVEKIKNR